MFNSPILYAWLAWFLAVAVFAVIRPAAARTSSVRSVAGSARRNAGSILSAQPGGWHADLLRRPATATN